MNKLVEQNQRNSNLKMAEKGHITVKWRTPRSCPKLK
jgi:hypothetical protein